MLNPDIVNAQLELLAAHRRTLAHLLTQAAQYGGVAFAPPQTANGIAEARAEIQRIKAVLRAGGVVVEEEPGDEAPPPIAIVAVPHAGDVVGGDTVLGDQTNIDTHGGNSVTTDGGDYAGRNLDKRQGKVFVDGNLYGNIIQTTLYLE
jgi:hypothetical protein